jgi:NADH-quinone oxidoreductase subunit H
MILDITIQTSLALTVLMGVLTLAGFLTWVERKQSALIQDRIGANRASIFGFTILGLFHPIADAIKMIVKEDYVPPKAPKFLFNIAPFLSVTFALMAFAAIPFGDSLIVGGREIPLQVANVNVGLLFIFAMVSMGLYGVILAGYSSCNNYAFLGGLRASSQMLSYEITMGVSILGLVMVYQTLNLGEMVRAQGAYLWGWMPLWGIVTQPVAFFLFATAAMAETKRIPFDLPEGESEIIGYFVEYSGMKFGMFMLTDFVETILASALLTALFLGGWQVPYLGPDGFVFPWGAVIALSHGMVIFLGILAFCVKVLIFCWVLMMIRWTLPRFRYDQLMNLGWKLMFPLSLANILITGIMILWLT